jgi:hypothetical protein
METEDGSSTEGLLEIIVLKARDGMELRTYQVGIELPTSKLYPFERGRPVPRSYEF